MGRWFDWWEEKVAVVAVVRVVGWRWRRRCFEAAAALAVGGDWAVVLVLAVVGGWLGEGSEVAIQ